MKRPAVWFALFLLTGILGGCGWKDANEAPPRPAGIAIMTIDDQQQMEMESNEGEVLQQVMNWLDRDIVRRLRDTGLEISVLKDIKRYSSTMGPLFIINVESFNPGIAARLPRGKTGGGPSSLALSYKLLDERGALLDEWLDGAESIKGGTYCARTLNIRAMERISTTFDLR
jgi:hypothetical protein